MKIKLSVSVTRTYVYGYHSIVDTDEFPELLPYLEKNGAPASGFKNDEDGIFADDLFKVSLREVAEILGCDHDVEDDPMWSDADGDYGANILDVRDGDVDFYMPIKVPGA